MEYVPAYTTLGVIYENDPYKKVVKKKGAKKKK